MNRDFPAPRPPLPNEIDTILAASRDIGGPTIVHGSELIDLAQTRLRVIAKDSRVLAWSAAALGDAGVAQIVALQSIDMRKGHGRRLWDEAVTFGRSLGCTMLEVETTNANLGAQAFYRAMGARHVTKRKGAVDEIKRLKQLDPNSPLIGELGVEIVDMLVFRLPL